MGVLYNLVQSLFPNMNLFVAVEHFTGGAFVPSRSRDAWRELNQRIIRAGFTGFEYCFFAMHHWKKEDYRCVEVLAFEQWMCALSTWEDFLTYKRGRVHELRQLMDLQMESVNSHAKTGYPLLSLLLEDWLTLNALTRIEYAIRAKKETGFDPTPVIKRFAAQAMDLLLGSPEYRLFTPHLAAEIERESDVYRCFAAAAAR